MSEKAMKLQDVIDEVSKMVIGQDELKEQILVALLSRGHILIEGAPGLAKTLTVSSFAQTLGLSFQRIQFTPDLLPSDLIGARIYNPDSKSFEVKKGPLFANIILADEINRAPSKVQSALLEAMQEGQVTIGEETFPLPSPFIVLATQNPLEQEGTFPLPEAQLDRFLLHTILNYPSYKEEREILLGDSERSSIRLKKILSSKDIHVLTQELRDIQVEESLYSYILDIVSATRNNAKYPEILYGTSPRASIALLKSAKARAFLHGRSFVLPEDIKALSASVLRHRLILSYEALAQELNADTLIQKILADTILLGKQEV